MISKKKITRPQIDLDGQEGNAFFLLGYAQQLSKQLEYSAMEQDDLMAEMKSGDYAHLVAVLDEEFGHAVDLITTNDELIEQIEQAKEKIRN